MPAGVLAAAPSAQGEPPRSQPQIGGVEVDRRQPLPHGLTLDDLDFVVVRADVDPAGRRFQDGVVAAVVADRELFRQALAGVPPKQRTVLVLRYYEGLDVASAAAAMGITEGTVKSQTSDALARLRTLLGDAVVPHTLGANHD